MNGIAYQKESSETNRRVLLIGGSSGVGKTVVARELAKKLSVPNLLLDDIRLAIQNTTALQSHPDLHVFLNYQPSDWEEPNKIFSDWITVGKYMAKPLEAIISHHAMVPSAGPIIIEGDGILPRFSKASSLMYQDLLQNKNVVCSVFIIEPEEERIFENLFARKRGFETSSVEAQRAFAHASWLFGKWLEQEANALGLPTVTAHPHDSLAERILHTLETVEI